MPISICRTGTGEGKKHVSIPDRVEQELRRACSAAVASLERQAQQGGQQVERIGSDTNALLNGDFGHVSSETKKWIAEQASSLGKTASSPQPGRAFTSADDVPAQNTDVSKFTRGTGDQKAIPIMIGKGKTVNLLISYTASPTYNKININAVGADAKANLGKGIEVRAAVIVERGGSFGAFATVKWDF